MHGFGLDTFASFIAAVTGKSLTHQYSRIIHCCRVSWDLEKKLLDWMDSAFLHGAFGHLHWNMSEMSTLPSHCMAWLQLGQVWLAASRCFPVGNGSCLHYMCLFCIHLLYTYFSWKLLSLCSSENNRAKFQNWNSIGKPAKIPPRLIILFIQHNLLLCFLAFMGIIHACVLMILTVLGAIILKRLASSVLPIM